MTTRTPDQGERLKLDAFAVLTANREAVIRRAQRALLTVLLETGSETADDVRQLVELPPGIVYTDPKLLDVAAAVETLPAPPPAGWYANGSRRRKCNGYR